MNVQGDEPFIEPEAIKAVARSLEESQDQLVMALMLMQRCKNQHTS